MALTIDKRKISALTLPVEKTFALTIEQQAGAGESAGCELLTMPQ